MKLSKIEELKKEYLDTLDNSDNNEWWCTEREVAEDFIHGFVAFLVQKNKSKKEKRVEDEQ